MKRACLEIQAAISKNTPFALYTTGVETSFIHIVIYVQLLLECPMKYIFKIPQKVRRYGF